MEWHEFDLVSSCECCYKTCVKAADGDRTRNTQSGNLMLYQLNYSCVNKERSPFQSGLDLLGAPF